MPLIFNYRHIYWNSLAILKMLEELWAKYVIRCISFWKSYKLSEPSIMIYVYKYTYICALTLGRRNRKKKKEEAINTVVYMYITKCVRAAFLLKRVWKTNKSLLLMAECMYVYYNIYAGVFRCVLSIIISKIISGVELISNICIYMEKLKYFFWMNYEI